MLVKLLLATALLIGTMVVMYRIQRRIKGEEGRGVIGAGEGRKNAQSASHNDLEQFVAAYRREKALSGSNTTAGSAPAPATAPTAQAPVKARDVFLAGAAKVFFLVLRAGLPDHHIFANARLADVIQLAGQPTTPQARAQLAQARIDFVVCNKELAIVALIDLVDSARSDDALKRALEPQFSNGGVRYVRFAPGAIPKPAEIRSVVYPT
jgi:hypothetical protein